MSLSLTSVGGQARPHAQKARESHLFSEVKRRRSGLEAQTVT